MMSESCLAQGQIHEKRADRAIATRKLTRFALVVCLFARFVRVKRIDSVLVSLSSEFE